MYAVSKRSDRWHYIVVGCSRLDGDRPGDSWRQLYALIDRAAAMRIPSAAINCACPKNGVGGSEMSRGHGACAHVSVMSSTYRHRSCVQRISFNSSAVNARIKARHRAVWIVSSFTRRWDTVLFLCNFWLHCDPPCVSAMGCRWVKWLFRFTIIPLDFALDFTGYDWHWISCDIIMLIVFIFVFFVIFINHFSGPGRAAGLVCVCVCPMN